MELKTLDIKGQEYVPVNERIKAFWQLYPDGNIITELVTNDNGVCVMKASILVNDEVKTTGYAYERENSTFINKTSYIENCETSAVGRALGLLGIGIDKSIASYEEVATAMENQKKIDATKVQAIEKAIKDRGITAEQVNEVLTMFGYKEIKDILVCDYIKVCNEFKEVIK